jgi:hypothetical protein
MVSSSQWKIFPHNGLEWLRGDCDAPGTYVLQE